MHLDVIPALLLVTGVIFLILLVLLNKTLYRPLLNFMENRDKSIKKDLENAGKNNNDIAAYKEEAEKIILDAKTEANKIREAALSAARDEAAKKIEKNKNLAESDFANYLKELSAQKVELKNALLESLPAFNEDIKTKLSRI
ncbi:MAG: F0F1 ATP synthase subunit B' [Sulfurospirillaceae bacterium]|nr:F0F1 ATP synthase subunit B' [Sulfurospirillaceae bacterium]